MFTSSTFSSDTLYSGEGACRQEETGDRLNMLMRPVWGMYYSATVGRAADDKDGIGTDLSYGKGRAGSNGQLISGLDGAGVVKIGRAHV